MTKRYLLAAEADKIQDFIFRAAHLREVVGGSQLLVRFCSAAPGALGVRQPDDVVVGAGGSFRIVFDTEQDARDFGEQLAELYRQAADGVLTVAEPVPVNGDYGEAARQAEDALRTAKRRRQGAESSPHLPIIAFCANCGAGLAVAHARRHSKETRAQHLCAACRAKAAERAEERQAGVFLKQFYALTLAATADVQQLFAPAGDFLAEFERLVGSGTGTGDDADPPEMHWPGRTLRRDSQEFDPVEDVADYDERRYVAYLVADGNSMGEIFGLCRTKEQVRRLSRGLDAVVQAALAAPAQLAMRHPVRAGSRADRGLIPVLPLILGGDDVFALLPAPWALDYAARFCRLYAQGMQKLLAEDLFQSVREEYARKMADLPGAPAGAATSAAAPAVLQPTMAAAVVICKASHPYALAHTAGHARLQEAKHAVKRLAATRRRAGQPPQPCSAVNFEVILGGQLAPEAEEAEVRATLRPYWIGDAPAEWGLPLERLLQQRLALAGAPNKRLAALRDLFDQLPPSASAAPIAAWAQQLNTLLRRFDRRGRSAAPLRTALEQLGGGVLPPDPAADRGFWRRVERGTERGWLGHGLPDLLAAWDWTLDLEQPRAGYSAEE